MVVNLSVKKRLWLMILIAVVGVCLLVPAWAQADQNEMEKVQKAIKEKKAKWEAGETSVSNLSPEEKQKRAGAKMPVVTAEEEEDAAEEQEFLATLTAPAAYDWRAADGPVPGNYVTSVKNQGSCGSCWAFATAAGAESQVLKAYQAPGTNIDLSEQLLLSCSSAGTCSGGTMGGASNYIRDLGLPQESCYPYTAANGTCDTACSGWPDEAYRLSGWHYVIASSQPSVETLKNALCVYGPLPLSMSVYSDFYYYKSGVYSYTSGSYVGGHAVLLVGYDDANQYFIVKNSWGSGWGEGGFFRIAYSEINNPVYFAFNTLAYDGAYGPGVLPDPPAPPLPACSYAIAPTSKTFKAVGGSGTITVSSQTGCDWSAVSNADWLTVNGGVSGAGSGTVSYTVAVNPNRSVRTGTIIIAGLTFTVSQQAAKVVKK